MSPPKNVQRRIAGVDRVIDTLRTEMRYRITLAAITAGTGVTIVGGGILLSGDLIPEALKWSFTVGGSCVSSLIGFPLRELFSRKRRVVMLSLVRDDYEELVGLEDGDEHVGPIDERFYKLAQ